MTPAISIKLPTDCWRFLEETRSPPPAEALPPDIHAALSLPPDVQAVLDDPPRLVIGGAISALQVVLTMTRQQAEALENWLHEMHDSLKHDDERRLLCLMCISRVTVAIMLSERL
jgi:hypothetical protein